MARTVCSKIGGGAGGGGAVVDLGDVAAACSGHSVGGALPS